MPVLCQGEEHPGGGVQPGGACREHGGEDDGVHYGGGLKNAGLGEHQGEGADGDVVLSGPEQVGVGIGDQEADYDDRADVEQQDPPEDGAYGAGDVLARVLGLTSGHAYQLGALERVSRYQDDQEHALRAAYEGGLAGGPAGGAGRVPQQAHDHGYAQDQEDDDGHDLDGGEPELALTVGAGGQGVDAEKDAQEQG